MKFRVYGSDRAAGALGVPQTFRIDVEAVNASAAREAARAARYAAGREHVHIGETAGGAYFDRVVEPLPDGWACRNCGTRNAEERERCADCDIARTSEAYFDPGLPLCSVCRRRHVADRRHDSE